MKKGMMALLVLLVTGIGLSAPWAQEKNYPVRPINMIVPLAPGGAADLGSKVISGRIAEFLGQPLISVYKPGGGGSLGSSVAAKAKPDGYTVLAGGSSAIILQMIVKKVDYKLDDLIPVGIFGRIPHMLVVKTDSRWKNLKDFVEEAKKSPGKLQVGSYGKMTLSDFTIMALNRYAGIELTHIPFKSSGEAITALLGGHIDAASVSGVGGLWESGMLRSLGVTAEKRSEDMPEVLTFKEGGYPVVITLWYSIYFPKGTPGWILEKFVAAQEKAFAKYPKEIKEGLRKVEITSEYRSFEETQKLYVKEYESLFKLAGEFGVVAK